MIEMHFPRVIEATVLPYGIWLILAMFLATAGSVTDATNTAVSVANPSVLFQAPRACCTTCGPTRCPTTCSTPCPTPSCITTELKKRVEQLTDNYRQALAAVKVAELEEEKLAAALCEKNKYVHATSRPIVTVD